MRACYGWPASHVRAHRETSLTGKWDPGLLDMNDHRAAVARYIKQGDDDMTPQEKQAFAAEVADLVVAKLERRTGKLSALARAVRRLGNGLKIDTDDKETRK